MLTKISDKYINVNKNWPLTGFPVDFFVKHRLSSIVTNNNSNGE